MLVGEAVDEKEPNERASLESINLNSFELDSEIEIPLSSTLPATQIDVTVDDQSDETIEPVTPPLSNSKHLGGNTTLYAKTLCKKK